jgi:hypothetical protein
LNRTPSNLLTSAIAALALAAIPATSSAQGDAASLRQRFMLSSASSGEIGSLADLFRGQPGTSISNPLAWGPAMGDAFIGATYQADTRRIKDGTTNLFTGTGHDDGTVNFGFGLGDANEGLGLGTSVSLPSYRDGFTNSASVSFQVFSNLNPRTAIAVGIENAFVSGVDPNTNYLSLYGVVSHLYSQPWESVEWVKAIVVTGGIGNGRFRMIDDIARDRNKVNAFTSVAIVVHERVSLMGEYTGQDINAGFSFVPLKKLPIQFTVAGADLTSTATVGPRMIYGGGLGFRF